VFFSLDKSDLNPYLTLTVGVANAGLNLFFLTSLGKQPRPSLY